MKDNIQFASFWKRFLATIIDTVLLLAIQLPLFFLIYKEPFLENISELNTTNILINYLLPAILVLVLWSYLSATPGKLFFKITIVDANTYEKPSKKQLVIRYFGYIISTIPLFLGFFWMLWDKKNQTWHDKISNTVLIKPNNLKL